MKIFSLIYLFLISTTTFAQGKFEPIQYEIEDVSLKEFLVKLNSAVADKDKAFFEEHISPDMMSRFDGINGLEEFKEIWNLENPNSRFWNLMNHLMELGGGKYKDGNEYAIPYVFSDWHDHNDGDYDVFSHLVTTGSNVNVRSKPSTKNSKILGKLNYDIVKMHSEKSYRPNGSKINYLNDDLWYFIETTDGKLKGYVYWKFLWSPISYRMGFKRKNGKWEISYLLAGD